MAWVWTARDSNRQWQCIASSSDGTILMAGTWTGTKNYKSSDSGVTWVQMDITAYDDCRSIAMSSDGSKAIAAMYSEKIWRTTNTGATWAATGSPTLDFSCCASSSDGVKLCAAGNGTQIYTSSDSGASWSAAGTGKDWRGCASSTDGVNLVFVANGDQIYTSNDSGATWTARESSRAWRAVASSSDGVKLVAVAYSDNVYTSTDSGVTWMARESIRNWTGCASSADGVKLMACVNGGQIYTSNDSGATWVASGGVASWQACASSSDGAKLVSYQFESQIYTGLNDAPAYNIIQETLEFPIALSFDANVTCAYHETADFPITLSANITPSEPNYLCLTVSPETNATSTYSNMPFTSAFRFGNRVLLGNETGLYVHNADVPDDEGTAIEPSIKTSKSDKVVGQGGVYSSQHRKRNPVSKVYLHTEAGTDLELNVIVDDVTYNYTDTTVKTGLQNRQIKIGRGIDGVNWQIEVKNFEIIESIENEIEDIRRRGK